MTGIRPGKSPEFTHCQPSVALTTGLSAMALVLIPAKTDARTRVTARRMRSMADSFAEEGDSADRKSW